MKPERLQRRRFLADLLFVGGALTAAALGARLGDSPAPEPQSPVPTGTPVAPAPARTPAPEPQIDGGMMLPQRTPEIPQRVTPATPADDMKLDGEVAVPIQR